MDKSHCETEYDHSDKDHSLKHLRSEGIARSLLIGCTVLLLSPLIMGFGSKPGTLLNSNLQAKPKNTTAYTKLTTEALRASLKVIATRNYAYFGFNTPEIQLHLPLVGNSSYASMEMASPKLLNRSGKDVVYQLERGLHSFDTQIVEIRFLAEDGKTPAVFDRAVGEISGTYPLEVTTHRFQPGVGEDKVRIKGEAVEIIDGFLPNLPPFFEGNPRAYDRAGNLLKKIGGGSNQDDQQKRWNISQFDKQIARVEVDTVVKSVKVHIRYDVPIAKPLPAGHRGRATKNDRDVAIHPKSKIEIKIMGKVDTSAKPKSQAAPEKRKPKKTPAKKASATGQQIAIKASDSLSEEAQAIASALQDLENTLPKPISMVQLLISTPSNITLSADIKGKVKEWHWLDGKMSGPKDINTQWLQCKKGMPSQALTLARIPALYDDATRRIGSNASPMQVVVGQSPCGTAMIYIPFEGGTAVQYEKDGYFVKVQ